jgi:hypothetical protein
MPPRHFTLAIIVFWLATAVWLFCREFLPSFQAGRPPEFFKPEYTDEVRPRALRWSVYQDDQPIGSPIRERQRIGIGDTEERRVKGRTFRLTSHFKELKLKIARFEVPTEIVNTYWVGLKGELRKLEAKVVVTWDKRARPFELHVTGTVEDDLFTPHVSFQHFPGLRNEKLTLDPVPVSQRDSFLNPMHPLSEVRGLRVGQAWRMPLVDPLGDALAGAASKVMPFPDFSIPFLDAEVAAGQLERKGRVETCFVIDYRKPGKRKVTARTWVRQSDGVILRQEAALFLGDRLVMDRGLPRR